MSKFWKLIVIPASELGGLDFMRGRPDANLCLIWTFFNTPDGVYDPATAISKSSLAGKDTTE